MIKVSVIVPVYNVEQYIDKCVKSLLNQSLSDIEIILVDDGSPDACPIICDQYAQRDSRVKVVHKKNGGLGMARNSGLDVALGEYIAFLDSDDYVHIDMYKVLYDVAKKQDLDICYCDVLNFDYKGRTSIYPRAYPACIYSGKDNVYKFASLQLSPEKSTNILVGYPNMSWNGLYKGSIVRDNKLRFRSEREYVSEDVLFHFENLIYFNRIGWIDRPLVYHYMSNMSSLTNTVKPQKIRAAVNMIDFVNKNATKLYLHNIDMKNAVDSYSIKLLEDISNSIGSLVYNPFKRHNLLYAFLKDCYSLLENRAELIENVHDTKMSYSLVLWSKGFIHYASILYSMRSANRRLKFMLKKTLSLITR